MKPQDVLFFVILFILLWKRQDKWFTIAGLGCLFCAMALYSTWIFFTAQRLVIYAAVYFGISIILQLMRKDKVQ